ALVAGLAAPGGEPAHGAVGVGDAELVLVVAAAGEGLVDLAEEAGEVVGVDAGGEGVGGGEGAGRRAEARALPGVGDAAAGGEVPHPRPHLGRVEGEAEALRALVEALLGREPLRLVHDDAGEADGPPCLPLALEERAARGP